MERHLAMQAGKASGTDLDVSTIRTLRLTAREPVKSASSTVEKPPSREGADAASGPRSMSDEQVLKALENRRAGTGVVDREAAAANVDVLPPEDTNTRLILREAVGRNAPVSFAVQLQWSVQAIDVKSIPKHPIFQAYTLYAAEGRRAGRTWFFLRLGFFSDAVSAKQVAHYLRRDFASAAVVPVSPQERQQAGQIGRSSVAGTVARGLPQAREK